MRQPNCPLCSGEGSYLGSLGHTLHFRCRQCGFDFCKTRKGRKGRRNKVAA